MSQTLVVLSYLNEIFEIFISPHAMRVWVPPPAPFWNDSVLEIPVLCPVCGCCLHGNNQAAYYIHTRGHRDHVSGMSEWFFTSVREIKLTAELLICLFAKIEMCININIKGDSHNLHSSDVHLSVTLNACKLWGWMWMCCSLGNCYFIFLWDTLLSPLIDYTFSTLP